MFLSNSLPRLYTFGTDMRPKKNFNPPPSLGSNKIPPTVHAMSSPTGSQAPSVNKTSGMETLSIFKDLGTALRYLVSKFSRASTCAAESSTHRDSLRSMALSSDKVSRPSLPIIDFPQTTLFQKVMAGLW